jgi:uncharacterized protein (DUF433 family)
VSFIAQAETPPLNEDPDGALRVGGGRVLLELVIRAFQDGATPEAIAQRYSTLALADVYATIAYYLRHRNEVDAYLAERECRAANFTDQVARQTGELSAIRARLAARRSSPL